MEWKSVEILNKQLDISSTGLVREDKPGGSVISKDYLAANDSRPTIDVKGHSVLVDELVLYAFEGYPGSAEPEKYTAEHLNGHREDCRLENLRWVRVDQRPDASEGKHSGVVGRAEREDIRRRYDPSDPSAPSQTELADEYGVSQPRISQIIRGER